MNCCKKYYQLCDPVPDCLETLSIKTPLASSQVTIKIVDKFNKAYTISDTSDSEGVISFDVSGLLPELLLNPYAGYFIVLFSDSSGLLTFKVEDKVYDALRFFVQEVRPKVTAYLIDYSGSGLEGEFDISFDSSFAI